jgi:uncharacterized protein (TIGR00297 family)
VTRNKALAWQSKLVLLLVLPVVGADVVLEASFWTAHDPAVAFSTLGLSALLGLVTWKMRAATSSASLAGAAITANLMFATATFPYRVWHTLLLPVLLVSLLAAGFTRLGRAHKEQLGTAEARAGRSTAQIAANLGIAALVASDAAQIWVADHHWLVRAPMPLFAAGLAALAEAAADTVSSEAGQVFGGKPLMITTLRDVEPGTDGAVSATGTLAGIGAAGLVSALGTWALGGDARVLLVTSAGAVFGLLFDSLLGATLEARGWVNNDAVNFLSSASAAALTIIVFGSVG